MSGKPAAQLPVEINLTAAIVAVPGRQSLAAGMPQGPAILVTREGGNVGLPSGPFDPLSHAHMLKLGVQVIGCRQSNTREISLCFLLKNSGLCQMCFFSIIALLQLKKT